MYVVKHSQTSGSTGRSQRLLSSTGAGLLRRTTAECSNCGSFLRAPTADPSLLRAVHLWILQEAIFGAVYSLTQDSILRDWRYAVRPCTALGPSQNGTTLSADS